MGNKFYIILEGEIFIMVPNQKKVEEYHNVGEKKAPMKLKEIKHYNLNLKIITETIN